MIYRDVELNARKKPLNGEKLPVAGNYSEKYACTRQLAANGQRKVFAGAYTMALLRLAAVGEYKLINGPRERTAK